MRFGIDVSVYQKGMSLAKAKSEGVEFVIMKAGGGEMGYLFKDSSFEDFYKQATDNKLIKGAYFFGYAITEADAIKEADYFCSLLKGKTFELPMWYDCEAKRQRNLPNATLEKIIMTFVNRVIANGYRCGVYGSSVSGFKDHFPNLTCLKWVACYSKNKPSNNAINNGFVIWQFGGGTNLIRSNQIAGKTCDQNYLYDESIINGNVPTPTPTPTPAPTPSTYTHTQFVKDVQKAIGAKVDGIAGTETISKTITVSRKKNNKHAVVKPIQKYLNSIGCDCGNVDGVAGIKTENGIRKFQSQNGCIADGEITAKQKTWKKLLKMK